LSDNYDFFEREESGKRRINNGLKLFPGVFIISLTLAYVSTKIFDYALLGVTFSLIMWGSLVGILLIITGIRKSKKALKDKNEYYNSKREKKAREEDIAEAREDAKEEEREEKAREIAREEQELFSLKKCYEILDLNENTTPSEIKSAYRNLAKQWHPDKHISLEEKRYAEVQMKEINQAYEKLRKLGKVD